MKRLFALLAAFTPALLLAGYVGGITTVGSLVEMRQDSLRITKKAPRTQFGVFVSDGHGNQTPLRIVTMKASTDIRGTLATTTIEIEVYNPNAEVLEGQFSLPIADGQTVSRFALDLNGKLRDAVVVDKSKARVTFEAIQRRKVDPALMEWTRDNAFRTRIYPINPRSTRRVLVAYEQELTQGEDGLQYTLPIAVEDTITTFSWDVVVAAFGQRPQLTGNGTENVAFSNRGRSFALSVSRENVLIQQPFVVDVPVVPAAHVATVNELHANTYASVVVASPTISQATKEHALPNNITIAWDASLSGAKRNHERELAFFDALFAKVRDVDVRLHVFAHDRISDQRFVVRDGQWRDLRKALTSMTYDGATQLGVVPFASFTSDLVFFVSDGVSTFGEHQPVLGRGRVIGIVTSTFADIDRLRVLCGNTGGAVYDLRVTPISDAMASLTTARLMLESVTVVDGVVTSVFPHGRTEARLCNTIVGVLQTPSAELELVYTLNGVVVDKKTLTISSSEHKTDGHSAARQWAQQELRTMAGDRRARAHEITQLGMKFGIVTPGTSLIVLETLQDYVRYNIEPPASEPELLTQWRTWRNQLTSTSGADSSSRLRYLTSIVGNWNRWISGKQLLHDAAVTSDGVDPLRPGASSGNTHAVNLNRASKMDPNEIAESLSRKPGVTTSGNNFIVRGTRTAEIQVLADGLEGTDQFTGGLGTDQVQAQVGDFGAEYGNASGGIVPHVARIDPRLNNTESQLRREALAQPATTLEWSASPAGVIAERWLAQLKKCPVDSIYNWYLRHRGVYGVHTGFYLDVSDLLREKGLSGLAIRVLSNLAELEGENHRMLRVLGRRLLQLGSANLAAQVFRDVIDIRDEEPQSYRDLALALEGAGEFQAAVDTLYSMAMRSWDVRFPEVELIALNEMNHIISLHPAKVDVHRIPAALRYSIEADIRVVMDWDADNSDIDLWVTSPTGEKCDYRNRLTSDGARLSRDLTGGYGPEEYTLPKAMKGTYTIKAQYYGDSQQQVRIPTTLQIVVYRNYGRANETRSGQTIRIGTGVRTVVDLGKIVVQ